MECTSSAKKGGAEPRLASDAPGTLPPPRERGQVFGAGTAAVPARHPSPLGGLDCGFPVARLRRPPRPANPPPAMKLERTIRYQADSDPAFGRQIMKVPGCEGLKDCIQCGTCSGVCPLSIYMDHTPRQIMALAREGFRREVLSSQTLWLCASCYACSVECPRQIRITDILYELKQQAIHAGVYPRHMPTPVLAREFAHMVSRRGRITESFLVVLLYLKTSWIAALGNWRLGLGLIRRGRFPLKPESIRQPSDLARMLAPEDAAGATSPSNGTAPKPSGNGSP